MIDRQHREYGNTYQVWDAIDELQEKLPASIQTLARYYHRFELGDTVIEVGFQTLEEMKEYMRERGQ